MRSVFYRAYRQVQRPTWFLVACIIGIILFLPYPTNLQSYRSAERKVAMPVVEWTEHYLRFTNTAVQIALPIVLRDKIGLAQLVYTGIAATVATHGLKRALDRAEIEKTRLGERPSKPDSHQNMPSGHSSMASCATYFVCRRYGLWHAFYLLPILLLTMYARVALNDHTVSAVIVGALVGFVTAALFTSPYKRDDAA
jgi:membrane-associated phospholipid phosphatase